MNVCGITDRGLVRQLNEDFIYYSGEPVGRYPNLFIVADGMGGHQAGDLASRFAVEQVREFLRGWDGGFSDGFRAAVSEANEALLRYGRENSMLVGMGTTLVLLSVWPDRYLAANVGDSRLYRLHGGALAQVTRDHSWVEEMYALGRIERDSAIYRAKKNIITRAIGAKEGVVPDLYEDAAEPSDSFLLCTDGLTNMLDDGEIERILNSPEEQIKQAGELVTRANEAGGADNVSVILIKC